MLLLYSNSEMQPDKWLLLHFTMFVKHNEVRFISSTFADIIVTSAWNSYLAMACWCKLKSWMHVCCALLRQFSSACTCSARVGTTLSVILAANFILFFSFWNNAKKSGVHFRVQVDVLSEWATFFLTRTWPHIESAWSICHRRCWIHLNKKGLYLCDPYLCIHHVVTPPCFKFTVQHLILIFQNLSIPNR